MRNYTRREWLEMLGDASLAVTDTEVLRRQHDFQPWVERVRMPPAAATSLERDILAAPQRVREYFDVRVEDGRLVAFTADYLVLRAVK
jgi:hypothetical protein